jgi:hypothetical protein
MSVSATSETRRKPGRPALADATEQLTLRVPRSALARLDSWRRLQSDLPSRPVSVRRLMELGLSAYDTDTAA